MCYYISRDSYLGAPAGVVARFCQQKRRWREQITETFLGFTRRRWVVSSSTVYHVSSGGGIGICSHRRPSRLVKFMKVFRLLRRMMLKRITLYTDLELAVPEPLHRSILFYRYFQTVCRGARGSGCFAYEETVDELAEAFGISRRTVQRALKAGEGRLWSMPRGFPRRIFLHSWERVYHSFGVDANGVGVAIRLRFLRGGISRMREVIYAMRVWKLTQREGDSLTRKQMASKIGVSVDRARRLESGWVEVTPCVEVLGRIRGRMIMQFPKSLEDGTRTWPATDGGMLVVRQMANRYRSRLFGSRRGLCTQHRGWVITDHPGLVNVPPDVGPVGAVVYDRELERERQDLPCLPPVIQVPAYYLERRL